MTSRTITTAPAGTDAQVSAARAFARSAHAEWARLWTVKATWWFVAVAAVTMVGLGTLLGFESAADPVELQNQPAWTTARFVVMPAQFAFLALALLAVTSDYGTGGIVTTLQWMPRRGIVFATRTIAATGAATAIGVLLTVACAIAAYVSATGALTLEGGAALDMLGKAASVLACGTMLAVGLGFVLRNTAGALVSVFLLMLVLPLLLPVFGDRLDDAADLLPGSGAIYLVLGEGDEMTTTSSSVVLASWCVGALVLGWVRFARDDANR